MAWILENGKCAEVNIIAHEIKFTEYLAEAIDGSFRIGVSPNKIFDTYEELENHLNKLKLQYKKRG